MFTGNGILENFEKSLISSPFSDNSVKALTSLMQNSICVSIRNPPEKHKYIQDISPGFASFCRKKRKEIQIGLP